MKIEDTEDTLQYLKGIVARMEVDSGRINKTYEMEDVKRDLLQLFCKIK